MIKFSARGQDNKKATHKNTFEFTKDKHVTKNGDCIIGVDADFSLDELKSLKGKIKIYIRTESLVEEIDAWVNTDFSDNHELVIRKSDYNSERTFAIRANKAAVDLDRALVEHLKAGKVVHVDITTNE
ncbi:MAG: DUF371 domain-containing protein [bacterium]|nr:DUF371 domain-containing protein [bacterium]